MACGRRERSSPAPPRTATRPASPRSSLLSQTTSAPPTPTSRGSSGSFGRGAPPASIVGGARPAGSLGSASEGQPGSTADTDLSDGGIIALARPEWIGKRAGAHSRSYLLASGTRAALPEGSPLLATEWLAVREVQRAEGRAADGTGAVIRLAAALSEEEAFRIGGSLLARASARRASSRAA